MANSQDHKERAHSKFSASGAERWFNCSGSVALSEGLPDRTSKYAEEGTKAHELLETTMGIMISQGLTRIGHAKWDRSIPREMGQHVVNAANFILGLYSKTPEAEISVEERIYLDFIHKEMFGTYDSRIVEHFGTLHVFDFKYGAGHSVSPKDNLQMIFYGLGVAHKYEWNFKRVRFWIIQPRIKGYNGPTFWEISIQELRAYVPKFIEAVKRVEAFPTRYAEGSWCHWCKAKKVCPLKVNARMGAAMEMFKQNPIKETPNGKEKGQKESKQKSRKEIAREKEQKEIDRWHKTKNRQKEKAGKDHRRTADDPRDFY